jgi:hypothetical protein
VLPRRYYLEVLNFSPSNSFTLQVDSTCPAFTNRSAATITAAALGAGQSGLRMDWIAAPAAEFNVQYTESLNPPTWITVPGVIRSTDGRFSFVDDGSYPTITDGGTNQPPFGPTRYYPTTPPAFATNRFYRVIQVR